MSNSMVGQPDELVRGVKSNLKWVAMQLARNIITWNLRRRAVITSYARAHDSRRRHVSCHRQPTDRQTNKKTIVGSMTLPGFIVVGIEDREIRERILKKLNGGRTLAESIREGTNCHSSVHTILLICLRLKDTMPNANKITRQNEDLTSQALSMMSAV